MMWKADSAIDVQCEGDASQEKRGVDNSEQEQNLITESQQDSAIDVQCEGDASQHEQRGENSGNERNLITESQHGEQEGEYSEQEQNLITESQQEQGGENSEQEQNLITGSEQEQGGRNSEQEQITESQQEQGGENSEEEQSLITEQKQGGENSEQEQIIESQQEQDGEIQQEQSSEVLIDFKRWSTVSNKQFPKGYHLATVDEVQRHRSKLLSSGALQTWDISRLLDGWIDGPGYANLAFREFRPALGTCILIQRDKDDGIKQLDDNGKRIAFLFACEEGLKAAEQFLQEFRKDIEAGPSSGICMSPLHTAIVSGDFDLCCRLVSEGADVKKALGRREGEHFDGINRKKFSGFNGATPLHLAIALDFEKFVLECLLKLKHVHILLQARDGAERTALHCAALSSNVAILKELLSAALSSNVAILKELLGHRDKDGVTVLHVAAGAKDSNILCTLLQAEVDVDVMVSDKDGRRALHVAAASGSVANVKALTKAMKLSTAAAGWESPDESGKTALVYAIESCQCEVIKHFLNGAKEPFTRMGREVHVLIGQSSTSLRTPLHYAVHIFITRKKVRMVDRRYMLEPLLEYATDTTREMIDLFWEGGEDSLYYRSGKNVGVLQLLVKYLVRAERAKEALARRSVLTLPRETSLQRAAKAGHVHLARLLLHEYGLVYEYHHLEELENEQWTSTLTKEEDEHVLDVKNICETEHQSNDSQIKEFGRQATDQPALDDSLGRRALVEGLAALLLNPFTGTPLTIGIYGEWGHGKSSLMKQVEVSLCTIAIQQALMQEDAQNFTDKGKKVIRAVAKAVKELVGEDKMDTNGYELIDEADILDYFVKNYDQQHHRAYKSLALTDTYKLLKPPADGIANGEKPTRTPAVLTVWYNAWQYQNETEALAGLAVEIIKEMESAMNMALWMSMCWNYAWSKNRQEMYIKLFFPVLIVGLLSVLFSTVLWNLLSMSSVLNIYKYTAPPICFLVLLWTIVVRLYKTVQPVSCKLFEYFNPMQHQTKLGYQHQVIADIKFMMTALCTEPPPKIWRFFAKCKWIWLILGLEDHDYVAGTRIFKQTPASDMRIVVLVDDLDRCNDRTILKVLSAINLVLSVCEINVILGIDKTMIHRALKNEIFIKEMNGDSLTEYARKFLRKIVQLPITLPDPTDKQMGQFLARQMGFLHKSKNDNKPQRREWAMAETEDDDDDEALHNRLLDRYTAQECNIMVYLQRCTHHDLRLPREWKRFLNYNRFACNILSKNPATQTFPDWKIELLVWVFVCWQWKNLMDTIIQDWRQIGSGRGSSKGDRQRETILEEIVDEYKSVGASDGGDIIDTKISLFTLSKKFSGLKKRDDLHDHQSWKSLLEVLENYNVSMKGIQIFQEFRFNCKRGFLPWPIEENFKGKPRRLRSMINHT